MALLSTSTENCVSKAISHVLVLCIKDAAYQLVPPYHEYKPTLNHFISVTVLALNKLF